MDDKRKEQVEEDEKEGEEEGEGGRVSKGYER